MLGSALHILTCGTTIPIVPRSRARMMIPGSLLLTRVTEVMPHRSQARDISPICSQLSGPCSPSSQTPSKPNCPRKSIMSVLACPDTMVTGCPSCNFRLIRFSRIQVLLAPYGPRLGRRMMGIVAEWQDRGNPNASGLRSALFLGALVENDAVQHDSGLDVGGVLSYPAANHGVGDICCT